MAAERRPIPFEPAIISDACPVALIWMRSCSANAAAMRASHHRFQSSQLDKPRASYAFALEIASVIPYLTVVHHSITAASAPIPPATPVHPIRIVRVSRCCLLF